MLHRRDEWLWLSFHLIQSRAEREGVIKRQHDGAAKLWRRNFDKTLGFKWCGVQAQWTTHFLRVKNEGPAVIQLPPASTHSGEIRLKWLIMLYGGAGEGRGRWGGGWKGGANAGSILALCAVWITRKGEIEQTKAEQEKAIGDFHTAGPCLRLPCSRPALRPPPCHPGTSGSTANHAKSLSCQLAPRWAMNSSELLHAAHAGAAKAEGWAAAEHQGLPRKWGGGTH